MKKFKKDTSSEMKKELLAKVRSTFLKKKKKAL